MQEKKVENEQEQEQEQEQVHEQVETEAEKIVNQEERANDIEEISIATLESYEKENIKYYKFGLMATSIGMFMTFGIIFLMTRFIIVSIDVLGGEFTDRYLFAVVDGVFGVIFLTLFGITLKYVRQLNYHKKRDEFYKQFARLYGVPSTATPTVANYVVEKDMLFDSTESIPIYLDDFYDCIGENIHLQKLNSIIETAIQETTVKEEIEQKESDEKMDYYTFLLQCVTIFNNTKVTNDVDNEK